jgi:hypothetical protein
VKARVNYVASTESLVHFTLDEDWSGVSNDPAEVEIIDARTANSRPSIDEEGFSLERLDVGALDYSDSDDIDRRWMPAVIDLVKRAAGAHRVVPWAVNIRFSDRNPMSRSTGVAAPARHVHGDFSADFEPGILVDNPTVAPAAAEALREVLDSGARLRWRCFNVWQQISAPPHDTPLVLCDARTVAADDVVIGRGRHGTFSVDLSLFRANPEHRWFYFSDMAPGETLLFSGFDPQAGRAMRRVPHTAVDDPSCPADAPARNSVEARAIAFYLS